MTPTVSELMTGMAVALAKPPSAEEQGMYFAGRVGVLALIATLCAQEADHGVATRVWENATLRRMLADAATDYPDLLLAEKAAVTDGDGSVTALDAANATLRRGLIALHTAVEARGDKARDRAILDLYLEMATRRRLILPGEPA